MKNSKEFNSNRQYQTFLILNCADYFACQPNRFHRPLSTVAPIVELSNWNTTKSFVKTFVWHIFFVNELQSILTHFVDPSDCSVAWDHRCRTGGFDSFVSWTECIRRLFLRFALDLPKRASQNNIIRLCLLLLSFNTRSCSHLPLFRLVMMAPHLVTL